MVYRGYKVYTSGIRYDGIWYIGGIRYDGIWYIGGIRYIPVV